MIAAHHWTVHGANTFANLVRGGIVADDVAQVRHAVVLRSRLEAGFQGLQVGVNVAEQEQPHDSAHLLRQHRAARKMAGSHLDEWRQGSSATGDAEGAARLEGAARAAAPK